MTVIDHDCGYRDGIRRIHATLDGAGHRSGLAAAMRVERLVADHQGAVTLGDRMQSEGSRLAEYLDQVGAPYEVRMAAAQFRSDVEAWTRLRTGGQ